MADARRVIVCGSRTWHDVDVLSGWLHEICGDWNLRVIVQGACPCRVCGRFPCSPVNHEPISADLIAYYWAIEMGFETVSFPANWKAHGRSAGHRRNAEMAKAGAMLCVAFIIGNRTKSPGSWNMVETAHAYGIPTIVVPYPVTVSQP